MNLARFTDAIWKRILMALVVSVVIVLSLQAFASSSDIETQKVQLESARGQHCERWQTKQVDGERQAECLRWDTK